MLINNYINIGDQTVMKDISFYSPFSDLDMYYWGYDISPPSPFGHQSQIINSTRSMPWDF